MATWWTNPEGKRLLVLKVWGAPEGMEGYDCFAVDLTPALAMRLITLLDAADVVRHAHPSEQLAALLFHDYTGEYYATDYDADSVYEADDEPLPPVWVRGDWDSRTELNRLEINTGVGDSTGWVQWTAYIKHCDRGLIETEALNRKDLQAFATLGLPQWPVGVLTVAP
jgi:hypothetical protein